MYLTKKSEEEIAATEKQLNGNLQEIFKEPEAKKGEPEVLAKQRRAIGLLTDSKIADMKGILDTMANQIIQVNKRMAAAEREKLEREAKKIPDEVLNLSKTEEELRQDLCRMLAECADLKLSLNRELKRLRREHLSNQNDIAQVTHKIDQHSVKLNNVCERQGLNDQAMASVFKIMKLDHAMDTQDEADREKIYLMGLTNTEDTADLRLKTFQARAGEQVNPTQPPPPLPPTELIKHSR